MTDDLSRLADEMEREASCCVSGYGLIQIDPNTIRKWATRLRAAKPAVLDADVAARLRWRLETVSPNYKTMCVHVADLRAVMAALDAAPEPRGETSGFWENPYSDDNFAKVIEWARKRTAEPSDEDVERVAEALLKAIQENADGGHGFVSGFDLKKNVTIDAGVDIAAVARAAIKVMGR